MVVRVIVVENTSEPTGSVRSIVAVMEELEGQVEPLFVGPRNGYIRRHGFEQVEMDFLEIGRHRRVILYPFVLARNARRLAQLARDHSADLVHVNDVYNLVGIAARPMLSVPVVYHVRLLRSSYIQPIYGTVANLVVRGANTVMAVSRAVAADLPRAPNVKVVHDGMRVPAAPSPAPAARSTIDIVYIGNYVQGKGQDHAIRAFRQAHAQVPSLRLAFVGGTLGREANRKYREALKALTGELGLTRVVTFEEETSDVLGRLGRADIALNLSESESFSMVCLEAMAAGRPVIASRCGGPEELLESGQAGVLVANRDPEDAAAAIVKLALDPHLRATMGAHGHREALARFDTRTTSEALLRQYESVIGRRALRDCEFRRSRSFMITRQVKALIKRVAPRTTERAVEIYNTLYHLRYRGRSTSDIFVDIYRRNHWRDADTVSGPGSTFEQTTALRASLSELCSRLGIESVLDVPCGDFHWMSAVELDVESYVGMDIVPDLIAANRERYAQPGRSFAVGDLTRSDLPRADLVFCRDCLVHLSYDDIERAIQRIKASSSTYLLTTSFHGHSNRDINTGNWRPVNLQKAPFHFPAPLEVIDERCSEADGRYADKVLLLFRVSDLPSRLAA